MAASMLHSDPLTIGQRVELHPATDDWMRGDRYGEVIGTGRMRNGTHTARVRLDRSGRVRNYPTHRLTPII